MLNNLNKTETTLLRALSLVSMVITAIVFSVVRHNEFVDLDDAAYIIDNRLIDHFNMDTVFWAFTAVHEANWHPLTMLSLAVDRQLWGLLPLGFHLTNLAFHCGTVYLLFFVYTRLLRQVSIGMPAPLAVWLTCAGSFIASLFFALHPLRVESVVWASERKDVLCLFFTVAAMLSYLSYRNSFESSKAVSAVKSPPYLLMLLAAGCALMSKPAAVSLPFVLLIIDWYPFARISDRRSLYAAIREKIPLLLMSFVVVLLTIYAQQYAITHAPDVDPVSRWLVACKALLAYLQMMLWPTGLAPYYPHPGRVAHGALAAYLPYAAIVIAAAAAGFVFFKKGRPLFPSLLLFYLITLAPMLGIIQVGGQWIADRYTYLPAVGLSLLWGGGAALLAGRLWLSGRKTWGVAVGCLVISQLALYSGLTWEQIQVWRNTETLAGREIELFPQHAGAAFASRSKYRQEQGDCKGALEDVDSALAIALRKGLVNKFPELSLARAELFVCLGRSDEAAAAVDWAVQTGSPEQKPEIYEAGRKLLQAPMLRAR